jgi:DNA-binding beta-propeller fold protein YncE
MHSNAPTFRRALIASCLAAAIAPAHAAAGGGRIVVADRDAGTISVIATRDHGVTTHALPPGTNPPEPMYVVHSRVARRVLVGDRANDRVVAFDPRTFAVEGFAPVGAGVFHMWGCQATQELWVVGDIDNTTSVIDMRTLAPVATVPTPADLVALGGKPHDVIVDPQGRFAYVTVIGVDGPGDYVVQVDARTHEVVRSALVGDDPHLSLSAGDPHLYLPSQGSDVVNVLERATLAPVTDIPIPGAHGAGMRLNGRYLYTTNLPGGGADSLWVIDTKSESVVAGPVDAPYSVPHNIALTPDGRTLYVTHSGPNDKVSVYAVAAPSPVPVLVDEVTVGANPFGLAYVP